MPQFESGYPDESALGQPIQEPLVSDAERSTSCAASHPGIDAPLESYDPTVVGSTDDERLAKNLWAAKIALGRFPDMLARRLGMPSIGPDDIAQISVIRAFLALPANEESGSYTGYLAQTMRRLVMDFSLGRNTRVHEVPLVVDERYETGHHDEPMAAPDIVTQPEDEETRVPPHRLAVRTALASLSKAHREVLSLYYGDETLSVEEVAEKLGVSAGTVRSRLHYGRNKLKALLLENGFDKYRQ